MADGQFRAEKNMSESSFCFPHNFRWGTATSSHQVEGNNRNNDWWAWEHEPNRILNGDKSGRACDWWENAEADFDRAAEMGTNAHRLSIEWSRIEPEPAVFDREALDRYREILLALHERNMEPMVTLHHFTNPLWLAEKGGWESEVVVVYFARYTRQVVEHLGDLVPLWVTINEPMVYTTMAYLDGRFPPGRGKPAQVVRVVNHLLRGHAVAYHIIHELQPKALVGVARNIAIFEPSGRSPLDRLLASAADLLYNRRFSEAQMTGKLGWPFGRMRIPGLAQTMDFYGLDYYTRFRMSFGFKDADWFFVRRHLSSDAEISDNNYGEIYPLGLLKALKMAASYGKPIYITENGLPDADDDQRPRFLLSHLYQVWSALQQNIPVMGYYHWSLVDNFEWDRGWLERFGLIEMDPLTLERRLRPSGELYGEICRGGSISRQMVERFAPELLDEMFPV
jgi:beta-glucosidase